MMVRMELDADMKVGRENRLTERLGSDWNAL